LPQAERRWCHDTSTSVMSGEETHSFYLVGCLLDLTVGRLDLVSVRCVHHNPHECNLQKLLPRRTSSILGMHSRRKYCVGALGTQLNLLIFPFRVVHLKRPNASRNKKVHRFKLFRLAIFSISHMKRHHIKHNAEKDMLCVA
jgi:hypothetical protein